jgi:FkbM family methyltransferase
MLKTVVQSILRPMGYYLRSTRHFGDDYWNDLVTLMPHQLSPEPMFFDVGAHHGETLDAARIYFPHVRLHCFEPDPESFAMLRARAAGHPSVTLHHFALGAEPGTANFHRNSDSLTNSLLPTSEESLRGDHSLMTATRQVVKVPIETLDAVCERAGIDSIDVLKTDCQGFDLRVLEGAARMISGHKIAVISCEVIFDQEYDGQGKFHELLQFLDVRGYQLVGFYNMSRTRRHRCTYCDVIFSRPETKE